MPHLHFIPAGWNVCNRDRYLSIRHCIIRALERNHDGTHFRVNITEDIGDSGAIEADVSCAAGFVKTEVEQLAFKKRKHIVEERVAIGKLHHRADGHNQNMRLEAFVVLE